MTQDANQKKKKMPELCDTKIGRPKKQMEICQAPKYSESFAKSKAIAQTLANTEKQALAKFQPPQKGPGFLSKF